MKIVRPNRADYWRAVEQIKKMLAGQKIKLMEVCGTHTVAISRCGLRKMLSSHIELISGPGCPVCVTPASDIEKIIWLAMQNVTIATFGDMMKVPAGNRSLYDLRAKGYDINIVYSPLDAVEMAEQNPHKCVAFVGVGFETTAPAIAGAIIEAQRRKIDNFFVFSAIKTIPKPLEIICKMLNIGIDGFILPGHVSAIIGSKPYEFIPKRFGIAGVIAGFEPSEIMEGILCLTQMIHDKKPAIEISYRHVVRREGNIAAQKLMREVFEPCDSIWRGLSLLPESGLRIRNEFSAFDAQEFFQIPDFPETHDDPNCLCGNVIIGLAKPYDCPLFGKICNPSIPHGPCMISAEGTCAAYYKYESER